MDDLILVVNRQLMVEYCSDNNINENSKFLKQINLFMYIKHFEKGVFKNGRYEIIIDEAMIDWGIYYIVRIKCQT